MVLFTSLTTTHHASVRLQAGSPPQLSQFIQTRQLRFFRHVARMDTSLDIIRALRQSIRGLPRDWRRSPGRPPRHTWLRTPETSLQPHNLGLDSAWTQPRIEQVGSISWKRLRCSQGHARDDDYDDDHQTLTEVQLRHLHLVSQSSPRRQSAMFYIATEAYNLLRYQWRS